MKQNKLTLRYKMEPGCLGPTGETMIEAYCQFAQEKIVANLSHYSFVDWQIEPRFDKSLPEMSYLINGKGLTDAMASRYLAALGIQRDDFEDKVNQQLMDYIEAFLQR